MKKVSIKYKWDEAVAISNVLHQFCNVPLNRTLQPGTKMLIAQMQAMYVKLAAKLIVHKATVRFSYDAVSAFAMIAMYCKHADDNTIINTYANHVLRTTVATLDQAFV